MRASDKLALPGNDSSYIRNDATDALNCTRYCEYFMLELQVWVNSMQIHLHSQNIAVAYLV